MRRLAEAQQEELKAFNEGMDIEFFNITKHFDNLEPQLKSQQREEIENRIEKINSEYATQNPKPSGDIITLQKTLELLVRQKEYIRAHDVQIKINDLLAIEQTKQEEEREKKIKKELDKLRIKHDNENNGFNLKLNQNYTEFKKKRALELEK